MEATYNNIDLIDDLWRRIFNDLDCKLRASIFQVCKRWKAVASDPLCWKTLTFLFPSESEPRIVKKVSSFCQFVAKYCSTATHVCIEKKDTTHFWTIILALFPLQQLRYLKFTTTEVTRWQGDQAAPSLLQKPDWSNMIYLNLSLPPYSFQADHWKILAEGAPNIEELCLNNNQAARAIVQSIKCFPKLKIFAIDEPDQALLPLEADLNPAHPLQIFINKTKNKGGGVVFGGAGTGQFAPFRGPTMTFGGPQPFGGNQEPSDNQQPSELTYIGNTLVISDEVLLSRDLKTVKKIGHVLKRTNYAYYFANRLANGMSTDPLSVPLLHYLFEELKLDINCCTTKKTDSFLLLDTLPVDVLPTPIYPLNSVLDDVEKVQLLLEFGADPNSPVEEDSPLTKASLSKESCILLLEHGADPLKQIDGCAVMSRWFTRFTDEDLYDILVVAFEKGVDVNQIVDAPNTILDMAIQYKHTKTVQELLRLGAKWQPNSMELLLRWNTTWWQEVISSGAFDVRQLLFTTALEAIKKNLYPVVREFLLNYPRDLDKENGFSLVHYLTLLVQNKFTMLERKKTGRASHFGTGFGFGFAATTAPSFTDEMDTTTTSESDDVQLLGQMIRELNLDVNMKTSSGKTPLLLVCEAESELSLNIVKMLIELGASVNVADSQGWTPLHAAFFGGKEDVAKLLLSNGANVDAQDKTGITPFMALVVSAQDKNIRDFFNTCDFDLTLREKHTHRSILHYIAAVSSCDGLDSLLKKQPKLDINCRDVHGFTPLHYAAQLGYHDMMKMLVEHGADVNAMSDTLALTPIAMYLIQKALNHPYHRYVTTYAKIDKTTGKSVAIFVNSEDSMSLGNFTVAPWHTTNHNGNARFFTMHVTSGSNHFLPWPTNLSLNDPFGNNLLHIMVRTSSVHDLIKGDLFAELHQLWSKPNKRGTTPFHVFAKEDMAKTLVERSLDFFTDFLITQQHELLYSFNNKDEHGKTALEYFFSHESVHQFASALDKIPGIEFMSPSIAAPSTSLLHSAINNATLSELVLTRVMKTDPNALSLKINGKTPFMFYIEQMLTNHNHNIGLRSLLDCFLNSKEVDLNAQDNEGNTALHYACYFFHLGAWSYYYMQDNKLEEVALFSVILFKLLDRGARVDIKNNEGKAPIDILPNILQLDRSFVQLVEEYKANHKEDNVEKVAEFGGGGRGFGQPKRYPQFF